MAIKIIISPIAYEEFLTVAQSTFKDMAKAVVDVEKGIIALGGQLHADGEMELIKNGSKQDDLWGINIYVDMPKESRIEFNSLINIRPMIPNRSMNIQDETIKNKITEIVNKLIG